MLNVSALWAFVRRGWCQHQDVVRLHVDGVWYFYCPCGFHTPVLRRGPGDRPPPKAT
jgi:hypothetical protein